MMRLADLPRPAPRSPWLRLGLEIARHFRVGTLTVVLPDGDRRVFGGHEPGPVAEVRIVHERALRRFLFRGNTGFAEAYMDGDLTTPDLRSLLEFFVRNERAYEAWRRGRAWSRWLGRLVHLARPNTRTGSRRNIIAHYDLGNAFYARWLDPGMTYSAARFPCEDASLEAAQAEKLRRIAGRIGLQPDHHLLEIGCGWGSFAELAAKEIGARVTAITVSPEQHAYASERMQAEGLNERVEVRLQDYRDVEGRFDRIASIEMIEAVGEPFWQTFFQQMRARLVDGGLAGLQVITIADSIFPTYRRGADFIQRYIFPGGMLPSPGILDRHYQEAGLIKLGEERFGQDYARTLAAWYARFERAWPEIRQQGFDTRFRHLWQFYLAYCEAGFRVGFTDVHQVTLKAG